MTKEEYLTIGMTEEDYKLLWELISEPFPDLTLAIPDGVKERIENEHSR